MALGDYILCCKCEVKLIYDGDRGQREWWEERFGKPPEIECPDCKTQRTWQGLTDEEIEACNRTTTDWGEPCVWLWDDDFEEGGLQFARAIEAKLKEKNSG